MAAVFGGAHKLRAESEGMSLRWLSIQSGVTPNCTFPSLMRPIGGREGASRETYLMIGSILGGVLRFETVAFVAEAANDTASSSPPLPKTEARVPPLVLRQGPSNLERELRERHRQLT